MPENNTVKDKQSEENDSSKKKLKMSCPYASTQAESHSIKFKDLIKLNLSEDKQVNGKASYIC